MRDWDKGYWTAVGVIGAGTLLFFLFGMENDIHFLLRRNRYLETVIEAMNERIYSLEREPNEVDETAPSNG